MKRQSNIPVGDLFAIKKNADTQTLLKFIASNINNLNNYIVLNIVYITPNNRDATRKYGISCSPTLIAKNNKYEGLASVIDFLRRQMASIDDTTTSLEQYQISIMNSKACEEDLNDNDEDDIRREEITRKMQEMQKRRPVMKDVNDDQKIRGGRPIKTSSKKSGTNYDDDAGFLRDVGEEYKDIKMYDVNEGDAVLENYYKTEADKQRGSAIQTVSRRR